MISEFMRNIILEYKELGLTANQAATQAEVNYRTARRIYEEADAGRIEREMEKKPAKRTRKRDQYKDFILEELQAYPAFSAKQLYDKLKRKLTEEGKEIEVSLCTFRRAVRDVRIDNNIPKPKHGQKVRVYRAVPEKAPGEQAQMDFGEYTVFTDKQRTKTKKIYFMSIILSYSRMRYVEFRETPLNTPDVIEMTENSIEFFGGAPKEIAIDQDTKIVSKESRGEIEFTDEFQAFLERMPFRMRVLHKSDPESKGKIERNIGYIKTSFLNGYVFKDMKELEKDSRYWLDNIANAERNRTTNIAPLERFKEEKLNLLEAPEHHQFKHIITQQIAKDNTVRYDGNRYEVPAGSYLEGLKVKADIFVYEDHIEIYEKTTGTFLAAYPRDSSKESKLFLLKDRKENNEESIKKWRKRAEEALNFYENNDLLIEKILRSSPDFQVDQMKFLIEILEEWQNYRDLIIRIFDEALMEPRLTVATLRGRLKAEIRKIEVEPQRSPKKDQRWEKINQIIDPSDAQETPKQKKRPSLTRFGMSQNEEDPLHLYDSQKEPEE